MLWQRFTYGLCKVYAQKKHLVRLRVLVLAYLVLLPQTWLEIVMVYP